MAMEFIGLAVGALTMIPFLLEMSKGSVAPSRTTIIRIAAGISDSGNGNTEMMGSVPGIALFDVGGNKIGQSKINDRDIYTWQDITIESEDHLQDTEPEYISLSAGKDAICVAYITVTVSSGNKYAWVGDIAKACGVPNYYTPVSQNAQTDGYTPACIWLNGYPSVDGAMVEGENGKVKVGEAPLKFRGMGIHITDFSAPADAAKVGPTISSNQTSAYGSNHDLFCKSQPRFWMYEHLMPDDYIPYFVGGLHYVNGIDADLNKILDPKHWATSSAPDVDILPALDGENTKRQLQNTDQKVNTTWIFNSTQIRQDPNYRDRVVGENITEMNIRSAHINANILPGHLITSNATSHTASGLCNDPSTAGPDFVSHFEQMYCDMATKTMFPLCNETMQDSCFDMNGTVFRPGFQSKRDLDQVIKSYKKVIHW